MLAIAPAAADPREASLPRRTPLFAFPLPSPAPACGSCQRFVLLDRHCPATGRCKLGIWPGIINRRVGACLMHLPKGAPRAVDGRAVRP